MCNNFYLLRSLESEFNDFKIYHLNYQFREIIYSELYNAYRRGDNVGLMRHCSQGIYLVRIKFKSKSFIKEMQTDEF